LAQDRFFVSQFRNVEQLPEKPGMETRVGRDKQIVDDAQLPNQLHILECADNALTHNTMHGIVVEFDDVDRTLAENHFPARRPIKLRDAIEYRRFSRTVRANQTKDFPLFHVKRQLIHRYETTETHRQILHVQDDIFSEPIVILGIALMDGMNPILEFLLPEHQSLTFLFGAKVQGCDFACVMRFNLLLFD
jgi:hypothetical protein